MLITHLHGDHYGGLPLMIFEAQANASEGSIYPSRTRALRIAGPAETEERVRHLLDVLSWRTPFASMKTAGLVDFVSLEPPRETAINALTVTAFPVVHTPEATALRATISGKTIAYSGDTAWTDTPLEVAADADLFICGVYCSTSRNEAFSTTGHWRSVATNSPANAWYLHMWGCLDKGLVRSSRIPGFNVPGQTRQHCQG